MKRTLFISMLAAALLGAQGRAADHIPTTITGWTHADESNWNFYGKYSETDAVTGGDVGIREDAQSGINHWYDTVYGGYSRFGTASGNNVTMDSGEVYSIYGGESLAGACVSGNTVTMNGGVVYDNLCGGFTFYDSENPKFEGCINNTVTMNGGVISHGFVKGGWAAFAGSCTGNTVTMNGGDVTYGNVVGGDSNFGNSTGNSVSTLGVISSTGVLEVVGGTSMGGEASGNKVDALESTLGAVIGGRSVDWHANDNKVTITDSQIDAVNGGDGDAGSTGNTVIIEGSQITSLICGGEARIGEAGRNTVTITNSQTASVRGGETSQDGNADGNTVAMTESTASSLMVGGVAQGSGTAKGNVVTITDSQIEKACGGIAAGEGNASDNIVTLTGSLIAGEVDGARANKADATNNKVTITDSQMQLAEWSPIRGGYAISRDATGNSVTITGTEFIGDYMPEVMGGHADAGNASGNSVDMTGGHVSSVYGGWGLASANENKVTLTDVQVDVYVYGGYSESGDATSNTVTMTGGEVFALYGCYTESGDATGNTVTINGGKIRYGVYGSRSITSGDASYNTVTITGGQAGDVTGGEGTNANGNTVTVSNSQVGGIFAAVGSYSTVGNTVVMNGGKARTIMAGQSNGGENRGNTVIVTEGVVQYGIAGGYLFNGGELRDNRVYLVGKGATATIGGKQYTGGNGGIQAGSIAAAYALEDGVGEPADLISGNAIDVYGTDITAGRMYGMQILNFHIMEGLANFDTAAMVSITGTVESDRLDLTSVQLGFYAEGVEDWSAFAGKSVTLVEAAQEILGVASGTQVDIMIDDRVVGTAALVLGGENRILSLEDIVFVPEPATGTLGLLALAALAARRRRK